MAFTYFFRDLPVIEAAAEHMIPFSSGRMRVKVWDAGSAMGQEPYTLAIVLAERMGQFAFKNLRIDATDHDSANRFGEILGNGIYPYDELKRMPEDLFKKYFETADKPEHYQIVSKLRERVSFQYHDLLSYKEIGTDYCLVVCKNVLLHFSYEQRIEVIKMYHRALSPGGYFTTEQTQKMPQEISHLFEQVVPDSQLYRKLEAKG
jgi:chemotaxis protein methyltransferase CheR